MDVNLPRDKETGKTKGFGFVMYEDQRSTILAVDNLNGAKVLERTLRVDHVKNYKQPKVKGEDGELVEREEQSLNAKPELIHGTLPVRQQCDFADLFDNCSIDEESSESSADSGPEIDPEDPMAAYLLEKKRERKAEKKAKKAKKRTRHENETSEERQARKERKKLKKMKKAAGRSDGLRGVEELLKNLGTDRQRERRSSRSHSPSRRTRSRSPSLLRRRDDRREDRYDYSQSSRRDERDPDSDRRRRRDDDRSRRRSPERESGRSRY
jgi:RNA-binding motif X-linked protein 2